MCVSYFVQYKKEHAVKASALLAQGQKKNKKKKKKITRKKMAWAIIEMISVYNKTNSCLSSTIEKVVYSA